MKGLVKFIYNLPIKFHFFCHLCCTPIQWTKSLERRRRKRGIRISIRKNPLHTLYAVVVKTYVVLRGRSRRQNLRRALYAVAVKVDVKIFAFLYAYVKTYVAHSTRSPSKSTSKYLHFSTHISSYVAHSTRSPPKSKSTRNSQFGTLCSRRQRRIFLRIF